MAVDLETLLVVAPNTDDDEIGMVLREQNLEVLGPVVKPRRHETGGRLVLLYEF